MIEQCRACLSHNEPFESIFNKELNKIFFTLTSIEISENDVLSNKICLVCVKQLNDIQKFREKCLESNRSLREEKLNSDTLGPEYTIVYIKLEEFDEEKNVEQYDLTKCKDEISLSDTKFKTRPTLKCSSCHQEFLNQSLLDSHLQSHLGEKSVKCEICGIGVATKRSLKRHMSIHLDMKKFNCRYCEKLFRSSNSRNVHENAIHTKKVSYVCNICDMKFFHKTGLISHEKCHSEEKNVYQCNECKKAFKTRSDLKNHLFTHKMDFGTDKKSEYVTKIEEIKGENAEIECKAKELKLRKSRKIPNNALKCPLEGCTRVFMKQARLESHLRFHAGENPDTCDVCGKSFCNNRALNRHMQIHLDIRRYKCTYCEKSFRTSDNRNVHENGVHTREKTFICHICGQQFVNKTGLISHNKHTHTEERKYHCNECPKAYKSKNELKDHLIRHRGIRDVICDICQATFLVKKDLQTHHKKVHRLKKNFQCTECDKQYKLKHQLEHHLRTHTGERPWTCSYCDKGFYNKFTMIKHTYSHTGERPFKCSKCPKAYTEIFILKRHMRQHHSE